MCLQLLSLDQTIGKLLAVLDATGVDYAVVLTADHGGHDLPERNREHGLTEAARMDAALAPSTMGKAIQAALQLPANPLKGGVNGDVWIDIALSPAQHAKVLAEAVKRYAAHPQVAGIYTRAQILATPLPKTPPETWTMLERARASFDPQRSGDFAIALKPRITPIPTATGGAVATHGSFWDYDRRVPILFWRKGLTGFEQPNSIETVDIAPTLAGLLGLAVKPGDMDGRCLDLDAGPGTTCR
jgi:arylsulfatase A-like enzyme